MLLRDTCCAPVGTRTLIFLIHRGYISGAFYYQTIHFIPEMFIGIELTNLLSLNFESAQFIFLFLN
jgi:hypothetical protein